MDHSMPMAVVVGKRSNEWLSRGGARAEMRQNQSMAATRKKTIVHEPDGGAMTLDEIAAFVQDAMRSGAGGAEVPKARVTFGAGIKRLEIAVSEHAAEDADR